MEITINVDETKFKDVLENELKAFDKDELHEILKSCIVEFFNNDENIKKMFLYEKYETWGYGQNAEKHFKGYEPTGLLNSICRDSFDYEEPIQEVKNAILEFCKKEENIKAIMKDMFADAFSNALRGAFYETGLRADVARLVRETIIGMKGDGLIS